MGVIIEMIKLTFLYLMIKRHHDRTENATQRRLIQSFPPPPWSPPQTPLVSMAT